MVTNTAQAGAHNDIKIFFRAEVGGETGFIHHVVRQPDSHIVRNHAAGAVRDVAKRPRMDHGRRAFRGLHQVGHDGFTQQRHHRASSIQVCCAHRLARPRNANHNRVQPAAQIFKATGQRHDGHDF